MLMLGVLFRRTMIMSHKLHHQDMRERAEQHEPNIHNSTNWNAKPIDGCQSGNGNQAACDHHPDV
jgi:hypothetical protein